MDKNLTFLMVCRGKSLSVVFLCCTRTVSRRTQGEICTFIRRLLSLIYDDIGCQLSLRLYLICPSQLSPSAQNPALNIHSISKSRRSISIRSQNPVAQNPFDLKIPSLKIHSVSESRRSKSIRSQNPVYPKSISFQNTIAKNELFWVQTTKSRRSKIRMFRV